VRTRADAWTRRSLRFGLFPRIGDDEVDQSLAVGARDRDGPSRHPRAETASDVGGVAAACADEMVNHVVADHAASTHPRSGPGVVIRSLGPPGHFHHNKVGARGSPMSQVHRDFLPMRDSVLVAGSRPGWRRRTSGDGSDPSVPTSRMGSASSRSRRTGFVLGAALGALLSGWRVPAPSVVCASPEVPAPSAAAITMAVATTPIQRLREAEPGGRLRTGRR
jgi:hypothetical protein